MLKQRYVKNIRILIPFYIFAQMRQYKKYPILLYPDFQVKFEVWLSSYNKYAYLNSNHFKDKYSHYDFICGLDFKSTFICPSEDVLKAYKQFYKAHSNDWLFGFFSYDLKNEIEELISTHDDLIGMPLTHFFQPEIIFFKKENEFVIGFFEEVKSNAEIDSIFDSIINTKHQSATSLLPIIEIKAKEDKGSYIEKIHQVKKHIQRGDIYEMNYCTEFYGQYDESIDTMTLYNKLNKVSPAPFSCLYTLGKKALVCSSPERFLKKHGQKMYSQPIKGTVKRGATTPEDVELKNKLYNSEKDRSENVMIVDLVRNDMSHFAKQGSVKVEELFGIYGFSQVYQMISTISCELEEGTDNIDAIMGCFPPGSMTGAPKIRAMQLIEEMESTRRGLYSGVVGYFGPEGDFDFNVVIRSILVNAETKHVSLMAGGAITALSDPESEYEECLIKAQAMIKVLTT